MSRDLRESLCAAFCGDLTVVEVSAGLAVSAMYEGSDGDRLGCLVEQTGKGWRLSDDGAFLGDLEAYGIDINRGGRAEFLARVLRPIGGQIDPRTCQVTREFDGSLQPREILDFLSVLSRVHDVAFWTRERVRSTFKEDATLAIRAAVSNLATIEENTVIDETMREFPADLVIRPKQPSAVDSVTAVYFVQSIDALQEPLVLRQELRVRGRRDIRVAALIEDQDFNITGQKATRAINRIDAISVFRNDEREAAFKMARTALPNLQSFQDQTVS